MKFKHFLPLFLATIFFTACVERTVTTETITHNSVSPVFSVKKETLKSRISAVIPSEEIYFSHGSKTNPGEDGYSLLIVTIHPDTLPDNLLTFYRLTDDIKKAVKSGIDNLEDYQKMEIVVKQTEKENGVERSFSYKKELDL